MQLDDGTCLTVYDGDRTWISPEGKPITMKKKDDNTFNIIDCELCYILISQIVKNFRHGYFDDAHGYFEDMCESTLPFTVGASILSTALPDKFRVYRYDSYLDAPELHPAKTYFDIYDLNQHWGVVLLGGLKINRYPFDLWNGKREAWMKIVDLIDEDENPFSVLGIDVLR